MRRNKTILILLVILLALTGVFVLRSSVQLTPSDQELYKEQLGSVEMDGVSEMRLQQGEEALTLTKEGDGRWSSDGYLVDPNKVLDLLQAVISPNDVTIISESTESHERLGIDEAQATVAVLQTTADEHELWLTAADRQGLYVRYPGEERVFLVEEAPLQATSLVLEDWIDTDIVRIPRSHIATLTLTSNEEAFSLEQRDGSWFMAGEDRALDTSSFGSLLSSLAAFTSQGLVDEEDTYEDTAYLTIEVQPLEGDVVELAFYRGEEAVKVEHNRRKGAFALSEGAAENLEISRNDLAYMAGEETASQDETEESE